MPNDEDDKSKKLDEYIDKNYPEAYIYYAMAKLFHWPPYVVDEIDIDLCRIFLAIEEKANARDDDEDVEREPKKKLPSFPKKWEGMKVEDIIKTEEFKEKMIQNEAIFETMKRKHNVK